MITRGAFREFGAPYWPNWVVSAPSGDMGSKHALNELTTEGKLWPCQRCGIA